MRKEFFNRKRPPLDLYMVNCGYEDCCLNFFCAPHKRKYFLIHYVTKGSGYSEVNGIKNYVKERDIFVIHPDEIVSYSSPDTENTWSFCWIGFNGNNACRYLAETGLESDNYVYHLESDEFVSVISNCLDYIESVNSEASQLMLNSFLLQSLGIICKRIKTTPEKSKASHIVERAVRYIEFNYMNDISPSSIAEFFSIDRTYFYRIFKSATGSSPESYIINYRIKKAADFLRSSSYSVGEIASFVGINDIYYFSKVFKKIKGVSPSNYRKNM